MKTIPTSADPTLAQAWRHVCSKIEGVGILEESIFDVPCDAVVSHANSFKTMDGGIDALLLQSFGQAASLSR